MSELRPPSVDALMRSDAADVLAACYGRSAVLGTLRAHLALNRLSGRLSPSSAAILDVAADTLARRFA